jgi:hypothetical protein
MAAALLMQQTISRSSSSYSSGGYSRECSWWHSWRPDELRLATEPAKRICADCGKKQIFDGKRWKDEDVFLANPGLRHLATAYTKMEGIEVQKD